MAQIGITKYKDLVNKTKLEKLKNELQLANLLYKNIANDEAVMNRESEEYPKYVKQYHQDLQSIIDLRRHAAEILSLCDQISFIISRRSVEQHVYQWDNDDLVD